MKNKTIMKKLTITVVMLLLAGMLAACGGDSDGGGKSGKGKTQKEETSGGKKDKDSDWDGDYGDDGSEDGQDKADAGFKRNFGIPNVEYSGLNPNWTDTDHLAMFDYWQYGWNTVFVLDFGAGTHFVSDLGIREDTSFGTMDPNAEYTCVLSGFINDDKNMPSFYIHTPEFEAKIDVARYEDGDMICFGQDDARIIPSGTGQYDIYDPDSGYGFYAVLPMPDGSYPVKAEAIVDVKGDVGTAEKAFAFVQQHIRCYYLPGEKGVNENYQDLSLVRDVDGNPVDLSAYPFLRDLYIQAMGERFGINFADPQNFDDISSWPEGHTYGMMSEKGVTQIRTKARHHEIYIYAVSPDEPVPEIGNWEVRETEFMGYKAVATKQLVYLDDGMGMRMKISLGSHYEDSPDALLERIERELFRNDPEEW